MAIGTGCGDKEPNKPPFDASKCIDADSSVLVGGIWALTTTTGLGNTLAGALDGANIAKNEINSSCGVYPSADATKGVTLDTVDYDMQDDPAIAVTVTQQALDAGVQAVVGVGSQTHAVGQLLVDHNMPTSEYASVSDLITRCTAAQLADSTVQKVDTPTAGDPTKCFDSKGLFVRFVQTASAWGVATAKHTKTKFPAYTQAAQISIAPIASISTGFKKQWQADGGTVQTTVSASTAATQADFSTYLKTAAAGNPQVIQLALRSGAVKALLEAYIALQTDGSWSKPAGFDSIYFINAFPILGEDFSTLSVNALAAAHNQLEAFASTYNENDDGFQAFLPMYQDYKAVTDIPSTATMRGYDSMFVLALAMVKAGSADPQAIADAYLDVANPPGEIIRPGEFKKARDLILAGSDVDYNGTSSGGQDLDAQGNATQIIYGVTTVSATGETIDDRNQVVIP